MKAQPWVRPRRDSQPIESLCICGEVRKVVEVSFPELLCGTGRQDVARQSSFCAKCGGLVFPVEEWQTRPVSVFDQVHELQLRVADLEEELRRLVRCGIVVDEKLGI